MVLDTGQTFSGKAGTASAITYNIEKDLIVGGVDSFVPAQGQLSNSTGTLFTSTGGQTIVKEIQLTNTTASIVSGVTFYKIGTAAANQFGSVLTIPANGSATYDGTGVWRIYDSTGTLLSTTNITLSGDATGSLTSGVLPVTLNAVNSNIGTFGSNTRIPTYTVNAKGLTTASSDAPVLTTPSGQTPVGATRSLATTAPLTGGGDLSADRTLAISAASASAAGSQSAAQFTTVQNVHYDVTNYGVSISNSGAANVAAMNTLIQTTAPGPSIFYFPDTGANYPMTGTITVTHNGQTFMGAGMRSSVIFVANTTQDLFSITDAVTNITFQDLGFWSTATATAGSVFNCGTVSGTGNQQVNFYRIGMEAFGGNHFNGMLFNGTRGGEVSNIEDCVLNSFRGWGIGVVGNTTIPNTTSALTMTNVLMNGNINGSTGALAGVYQQQCGALQINNCDIIQCTNSLLTNPITSVNQVVASIFANNTYFDSSYGSCIKIGGTQPVVRCKFTNCSMTVSAQATAPNANAFEVNNSAANPPADIDLLNCNFQNTFNNTAASNGILLTTVMNIKIVGNNISGWTNNIQVTPAAAGVTRLNIIGNTIGPGSISHTATAVGILLNAGAAAYGLVQILDNVFPLGNAYQVANTVNITDNSTLGATTAATGQKVILNNSGLISPRPANYTATAIPLTTVTGVNSQGGIFFPPGVRPSSGRITVYASNSAAAQTLTMTVKYGINNSNADTTLQSITFAIGTAVVGSATFLVDFELVSATQLYTTIKSFNGNNAATGIIGNTINSIGLATPATVATNVNNWLGVYFASTVANVITIRSVKEEVQSQ